MAHSQIGMRKAEHLKLCCEEQVEFQRKTTLLEDVELIHQCVPSVGPDEVDMRVEICGKTLKVPLIIGAMTGGTSVSGEINRALAEAASRTGIGIGLGSQRPMFEDRSLIDTYQVRDVAPNILLLGNIGLFQARKLSIREVATLMEDVGADAMCLHLNAAMELFQAEGDRDFSKVRETVERLAHGLGENLIVKETGCGISREAARLLKECRVRRIDVAGAGGTSWVQVENLRKGRSTRRDWKLFEEWGIPTAASLLEVAGSGMNVIASGGVRTGLDIAKCIALGAEAASAALPFLKCYDADGVEGILAYIDQLVEELRAAMVLTGSRDLKELRRSKMAITGKLRQWMQDRRT